MMALGTNVPSEKTLIVNILMNHADGKNIYLWHKFCISSKRNSHKLNVTVQLLNFEVIDNSFSFHPKGKGCFRAMVGNLSLTLYNTKTYKSLGKTANPAKMPVNNSVNIIFQ
jgi:hypothetical protein